MNLKFHSIFKKKMIFSKKIPMHSKMHRYISFILHSKTSYTAML